MYFHICIIINCLPTGLGTRDCVVIFFSACLGMPGECLPGDICGRLAEHVASLFPVSIDFHF